jgi:uncharacterized protein
VLDGKPKRSGAVGGGAFSRWVQTYLQEQMRADPTGEVPCGDCNACCRSSYFITVHSEEREAIERLAPIRLTRSTRTEEPKWTLEQDCAGACPMLVDGACSIYGARPRTCRRFDCRVFAAAGVGPGTGPRAALNARVWQWRFEYPTEQDEACQNAVLAAAAFLQRNAALVDAALLPNDRGALAKAAVLVYQLFLDTAAQRDDAQLAAAIEHVLRQRAVG